MLAADRQRVSDPGFIAQAERVWHFLPVTDQIAGMIPGFVFEGSFATAWNSVTRGMAEKVETMRVVLETLLQGNDGRCVRDIEGCIQKLGVKVVDGEAKNTQFLFDLMEHMIENSNNVWKAQTNRIGWLWSVMNRLYDILNDRSAGSAQLPSLSLDRLKTGHSHETPNTLPDERSTQRLRSAAEFSTATMKRERISPAFHRTKAVRYDGN
jgi:predicted dinucleotide-binding enzyme